MTTPQATPYDIVDLPPFPWEPDGRAWLILSLLLILLFLITRLFSRHTPRTYTRSAREAVMSNLRALGSLTRNATKEECAKTSYDIRRYLELSLGIPLRGGYFEGISKELPRERREVLKALEGKLRELDTARYAPNEEYLPEPRLFIEILSSINSLEPDYRPTEES